jgi:hypothetical protein
MTRDEYLRSEERRARIDATYAARKDARRHRKKKDKGGRDWKDDADTRGVEDHLVAALHVVHFQPGEISDNTVEVLETSRARERERATNAPVSDNFAAFETHTRGIGGKILAQMGFKPGLGLGKDAQGIAEAPNAEPRKKHAGLGG